MPTRQAPTSRPHALQPAAMLARRHALCHLLGLLSAAGVAGFAGATGITRLTGLQPTPASAQNLPQEIVNAFAQQRIPLSSVGLMLAPVHGQAVLQNRADAAMNPASVMKLITSCAALDQLGPAFTWKTQVFLEGRLERGTLRGNLLIKGGGDPKLVSENLYALMRRVRGLGIHTITGDVVLDNSAFVIYDRDPSDFDGNPSRPYNAQPDALLVNFRSQVLYFTPMQNGSASVLAEPTLGGAPVQASVPLNDKACNDWRAGLRADIGSSNGLSFAGSYPASCGTQVWPLAYADPQRFAMRAIAAMWTELGGRLDGQVRLGQAPASAPVLEYSSPSLLNVLLDMNKFSNNVMARHVFLTLSLQAEGRGTLEGSRRLVDKWWKSAIKAPAPMLDNGSGLSLQERSSAAGLVALLQYAWQRPWMPELLSTLPIAGIDGTLRHSQVQTPGSAHVKTGSMPASGVSAIAGIVDAKNGQRYALAILVNHPNAAAARPAYDAVMDWAMQR